MITLHKPLLLLAFTGIISTAALQADSISLFDGKSLDGWTGDTSFWKVEDGAITGESTAANPCKKTTYLTYNKLEFGNFELSFSFRFMGDSGNSGIQYRSQWKDKASFQIKGYQADMETGKNYSGILYDQDGRGIVAKRGEHVTLDEKGKKTIKKTFAKSAELAQQSLKLKQWNTYKIVADGHTLTHEINGHKTIQVDDHQKGKFSLNGLLAIQLHQGPAMKVQFKDILMLEMEDNQTEPQITENIKVLPGFKVSKIYQVEKKQQGSWVSMCFDDKGTLYTADQYGALFRVTLKEGQVQQVEKLDSPANAQGLCWAFDSLYLTSQAKGKQGVHRMRDTNNDGKFDKVEHIVKASGTGEHGPHSVIKAADGKNLIVVLGNHTKIPADVKSLNGHNWAEDTLHPHLKDSSGHAVSVTAPGGTLIQFSADGSEQTVIASGMRNTYDIAANTNGALFGYDSDMEYDIGTPWYRPTRVMHYIDGAEFGWRTGTAKWPAYYADSLGAVENVGPGSPTGVSFGFGAKFPADYQRALYILDWTFGRIYALHLEADGATYRARRETFLSGKPLPLTDIATGPDGSLYFTTGGRRLESALYRVDYVGTESTKPVQSLALNDAQKLQMKLQASADFDTLWDALSSPDRTLRYTARIGLEKLPLKQWVVKYSAENKPQTLITSTLAFARMKGEQKLATQKLLGIDYAQLDAAQKIEYLRACSLVWIRLGCSDSDKSGFIKKLSNHYPSYDKDLDSELARTMIYLGSPLAVTKTVALMETAAGEKQEVSSEVLEGNAKYAKDIKKMLKNHPETQALHYALMLKNAKSGWTDASVLSYYAWLNKAASKSGGRSYKGFINNIRKEALNNLSEPLKKVAASAPQYKAAKEPVATAEGPGRNWDLEGALAATSDLSKANIANGKKMYQAALCSRCHNMAGAGGNSGPELTNVGSRFTTEGILKAIIDPSEVISEQYNFSQFDLKDGSSTRGKVMQEDDSHLSIAVNPFDLTQVIKVKKSQIVKISHSPVSPMPPAMINTLNPDELRDLMSYLKQN